MRFAKGHGTENDFVILLDPDDSGGLTADLTARLCDRRAGIGADGVLRAVRAAARGIAGRADAGPEPASGADGPEWFMDYRNADGSVAEMCGNGVRVYARYLEQTGWLAGTDLKLGTRGGVRTVRLAGEEISVDMGPAAVGEESTASVDGQAFTGVAVDVGNPHLACLVDGPLSSFDLSRAPGLDPGQFPGGGNVELVQVTGPASVAMRVHERGSGETRSCGTGAVAAAAAAATGSDGTWDVRVPGGDLKVTLEGGRAWLTGPAVIVAEGELDPSWLATGHLASAGTVPRR